MNNQADKPSKRTAFNELPEYYTSQAEETFASLPYIRVEKTYCHHRQGSSCSRCIFCCPQNAISLREESAPVVDENRCNGCGICVGVCDAFVLKDINLHQLHKQILRIAVSGRRVYLTCGKNLPTNYRPDTRTIILPCLSMLSPAFFTMIMAEGVDIALACRFEACENCEIGGEIGGALYPCAIEIAQDRTNSDVMITQKVPKEITLTDSFTSKDDPLGRRQAFESFATDLAEIASGKRRIAQSSVLQDYCIRKQQNRIHDGLSIPKGIEIDMRSTAQNNKGVLFPQYKMLVTAVMAKPEIASKINLGISVTDKNSCCNSLECTHSCPTGARYEGKNAQLAFDSLLCIGCGICVDACPHDACSVETSTAEKWILT